MRWYVNEASIQGQFATIEVLTKALSGLLSARAKVPALREGLRVSRRIGECPTVRGATFRECAVRLSDREIKGALLTWIDRSGPFTDDERLAEVDDYFECCGVDVTEQGLGEAARRLKSCGEACSFSFEGGDLNFAISPLEVVHGLPEDVLGVFSVQNFWKIEELERDAAGRIVAAKSWRELVEQARMRFPKLQIPDSVYLNQSLSREPFDTIIRDRTIALLGHLHAYMLSRTEDGRETERSREIVQQFFAGERALFTGESSTNQHEFQRELTFAHPVVDGATIFAHWHGKISHRFFRLHIEWPVPPGEKAKVLYLGPKITKS